MVEERVVVVVLKPKLAVTPIVRVEVPSIVSGIPAVTDIDDSIVRESEESIVNELVFETVLLQSKLSVRVAFDGL